MANISELLQKIKDAVYGEEVRGSIHDAIAAMNQESSDAMSYARTAQDSATNAASRAASSASVAAESASDAQAAFTSATAAKSDAQSAAESANEAASIASDSAQAALEAKNDLEEASNNARVAMETAISARNDAETARDNADAAKSSAAASARDSAASASVAMEYSGNPAIPRDGTWWVWNAEQQSYVDTGITCELEGPVGVGIESISLSGGSHQPGGTDVYTITLTDGRSYSFPVYNGRNGDGVGNVIGYYFDLILPASDWDGNRLVVENDKFVASSSSRYFISADGDDRERFLSNVVRPADITVDGQITFTCSTVPEADITINVIRLDLAANA